ncbi:MAG: hypothetical protein ACOY3Y_06115, partial [Acidobacteriota bacterium]
PCPRAVVDIGPRSTVHAVGSLLTDSRERATDNAPPRSRQLVTPSFVVFPQNPCRPLPPL